MNTIQLITFGTVALSATGLFVGGAGVTVLRRRQWPRFGLVLLGTGLAALAVSGVLFWKYGPLMLQLFKGDVDDPERRARLQDQPLDRRGEEPAPPGEWPQWRGYHRDGVSTDTGLRTTWPDAGPPEVWHCSIGGGYSSPAISKGRLYITDRKDGQERVLCLDAASGKELWQYRYDVNYGGFQYQAGPRATPTVHDGRVYTVGATGVFLCLEAEPQGDKAHVLWEKDLRDEFGAPLPTWGIACSPLVEGDLVIVQPGGDKGSVAAFDRKSGKLAWSALDDRCGYSSPVAVTAAGKRQVVCFTAKRMVGLSPADGELLWDFGWSTMYDANIATPVVAGNYVFLSSDYSTGCALLELEPAGDGVKAAPVFVRRDNLMRNQFSTCVLHDGHLYGFDVAGHGGSGRLKCVSLRTFEEKWQTRDLHKGCVLVADGHLIVLTERGELALVEATPAGYRKKAVATVLDGGDCWAVPALASGRLYLRDNQQLRCLDLRK
jgi:outer membrane protein assembly factor BamB